MFQGFLFYLFFFFNSVRLLLEKKKNPQDTHDDIQGNKVSDVTSVTSVVKRTSELCTRPSDNRCMWKYMIRELFIGHKPDCCLLRIIFTGQLGINFDYFISEELQMF